MPQPSSNIENLYTKWKSIECYSVFSKLIDDRFLDVSNQHSLWAATIPERQVRRCLFFFASWYVFRFGFWPPLPVLSSSVLSSWRNTTVYKPWMEPRVKDNNAWNILLLLEMFNLIQVPNLRWIPEALTHGASPTQLATDTIQENVRCFFSNTPYFYSMSRLSTGKGSADNHCWRYCRRAAISVQYLLLSKAIRSRPSWLMHSGVQA